MRVAVVDIGTNSTRLLIADVEGHTLREIDRRTTVTRLGQGVDATGELAPEAMDRVFTTLVGYRAAIDQHRCDATTAVLTSAVRDARNGADFTAAVRDRYGLEARTISGLEEARLTFAGATAGRGDDDGPLVVIDIGGGSTELVTGENGEVGFHTSVQAGVVRQTERHLAGDPPTRDELDALREEAEERIEAAVPPDTREQVQSAVAVAGTATSCAAIDQALEPYDPERVHGHVIERGRLEDILRALASLPLAERRSIAGLHPDRAPTIVAGVVILVVALEAFGLDQVEVSEHDILHGTALDLANDA